MPSTGEVWAPDRAQMDFTQFFVAFQPKLVRQFRRQATAMNLEVEDLVQETLIRAYVRRAEFAADENMLAWCRVVAARLLIRWANAADHRLVDLQAEIESVAVTLAPDSAEIVLAAEEIAEALAAYRSLSDGHRVVLHDHLFLERSCPEIARIRGSEPPAVRKQLSRARAALRRAFAEAGALTLAGFAFVRRAANRVASAASWTTAAANVASILVLVPGLAHLGIAHDGAVALPPVVAHAAALDRPAAKEDIDPAVANVSHDRDSLATAEPRESDKRSNHRGIGGIGGEGPDLPVCLQEPCMDGDTVGVDLPVVGHKERTENAAPVCDQWVPNPAVTCERHGDPEWVAPSPSASPSPP